MKNEKVIRKIWNSMLQCNKKRKIKVKPISICDEWMVFENFYKWADPRHMEGSSLRRTDRTLGYFPENCNFLLKGQVPIKNKNQQIRLCWNKARKDYARNLDDSFLNYETFFKKAETEWFPGAIVIRDAAEIPLMSGRWFFGTKLDVEEARKNRNVSAGKKRYKGQLNKFTKTKYNYIKTVSKRKNILLCKSWLDRDCFASWVNENYFDGCEIQIDVFAKEISQKSCFLVKSPKMWTDSNVDFGRITRIAALMRNSSRKYRVQFYEGWLNRDKFIEWYLHNHIPGLRIVRKNTKIGFDPYNCYFGSRDYSTEESVKRARQTKIDRYGVGYKVPYEKAKATMLKRYGVESACQHPEFREKVKKTTFERYGVEYANQLPEVKEKMIATFIKNYGVMPGKSKVINARIAATVAKNFAAGKYKSKKLWQQIEVSKIIEDFGIGQRLDREVLDGKEIDIYCESEKIGIEYCGLYWHSHKEKSHGRTKHHFKYEVCRSKGIKLLTIFENELKHKKPQMEALIRREFSRLSLLAGFTLKEIAASEAASFIEENEILAAKVDAGFGLFVGGELASVAAVRKFRGEGRLTLSTKMGYEVLGGDAALAEAARLWSEKAGVPLTAVTDNRHGSGERYERAGFTLKAERPPRVACFDNKTKKIVNKKMADNILSGVIEGEIRYIWDCGTRVWKYD